MRKSKFTDSQILAIMKQAEEGTPLPTLCWERNISGATLYWWRSKFCGMDALLMARLNELEEENQRLKKIYAEERARAEIVQKALEIRW